MEILDQKGSFKEQFTAKLKEYVDLERRVLDGEVEEESDEDISIKLIFRLAALIRKNRKEARVFLSECLKTNMPGSKSGNQEMFKTLIRLFREWPDKFPVNVLQKAFDDFLDSLTPEEYHEAFIENEDFRRIFERFDFNLVPPKEFDQKRKIRMGTAAGARWILRMEDDEEDEYKKARDRDLLRMINYVATMWAGEAGGEYSSDKEFPYSAKEIFDYLDVPEDFVEKFHLDFVNSLFSMMIDEQDKDFKSVDYWMRFFCREFQPEFEHGFMRGGKPFDMTKKLTVIEGRLIFLVLGCLKGRKKAFEIVRSQVRKQMIISMAGSKNIPPQFRISMSPEEHKFYQRLIAPQSEESYKIADSFAKNILESSDKRIQEQYEGAHPAFVDKAKEERDQFVIDLMSCILRGEESIANESAIRAKNPEEIDKRIAEMFAFKRK